MKFTAASLLVLPLLVSGSPDSERMVQKRTNGLLKMKIDANASFTFQNDKLCFVRTGDKYKGMNWTVQDKLGWQQMLFAYAKEECVDVSQATFTPKIKSGNNWQTDPDYKGQGDPIGTQVGEYFLEWTQFK